MSSWVPIISTDVWVVRDIFPKWYKYITNDWLIYKSLFLEILSSEEKAKNISNILIKNSKKYQWNTVSNLIEKLYIDVCTNFK